MSQLVGAERDGGGGEGRVCASVLVVMCGRCLSLFICPGGTKRTDLWPTFHTSLAEETKNKDSVQARPTMYELQHFYGPLPALLQLTLFRRYSEKKLQSRHRLFRFSFQSNFPVIFKMIFMNSFPDFNSFFSLILHFRPIFLQLGKYRCVVLLKTSKTS